MTKRVTAKSGRSVLRILENLFTPRAPSASTRSSVRCVKIVHMEVEVHRSPVAFEFAPISGIQ